MPSIKTMLLAGASAVLLAGAFASPASAATLASGGGSSLIAPYMAQAFGAYGGGGPATATPAFSSPPVTSSTFATTQDRVQLWTQGAGAATQVGAVSSITNPNTTDFLTYLSSNSGGGITGVYTGFAANLGTATPNFSRLGSPNFGFSDLALTAADIGIWNAGGSDTTFPSGFSFASGGTASGGPGVYEIPGNLFGALIQIPDAIVPIALAVNSASLNNIQTIDTKVHLTKALYCAIFNGQITDWSDPAFDAVNGGTPYSTTSLHITLVGRTDGSGTSSIFQTHLATVCASGNAFGYTGPNFYTTTIPQNLPTAVKPGGSSANPFTTLQSGSGGVQSTVLATAGAIGYIGPDFLLGTPTGNLDFAELQEGTSATSFLAPNATTASTAFGTASPPQSNSDGTYNHTAPGDRTSPADWVPVTANPTSGYPITGTTNIVTFSDQGSTAAALLVTPSSGSSAGGFLTYYYCNASGPGSILSVNNLAELPPAWKTAVCQTFINTVTATAPLALNIH
ncbi:MAG: substrate-binding domain-containing protein [Rhizomicrobium sp.]